MMRRIDRMVILCLVMVNITLIVLVAFQGRRIAKAIEELEQQRQQTAIEPAQEEGRMAEQAFFMAPYEAPSAPETTQSAAREETFTAYAYCPCEKCCGVWAQYGKTASGTVPKQGRTVAVDPGVIPLGTELWIDGDGPYIAEDTGSGIDGNTLDVFFDSHEQALNWGKREVQVAWKSN